MELTALLAHWRGSQRFMEQVAEWRTLPACAAQSAEWPSALARRVIDAYRLQGIEAPYTHQAEAITAALEGAHVVLVSPTASGKTLAYNAPVLHTLLTEGNSCALYLFPTKALAQDQLHALASLNLDAPLRVAAYDGDTQPSARKQIRESARLLITNPDMLHTGILPYHPRWRRLLANLRYVVIDELHTYRGVFGSNVANVLRRLGRLCAFYGASPQFVCTSATIANPEAHARALLDLPQAGAEGHPLHVVTGSGAPRGVKYLIFYNPPLLDEELGLRRGVVATANDLARQILRAGAQTAVFARARLTVEVLLTYLRDFAALQGWPAETVRGYRGGYLPSERRAIEAGLRAGSVRGVVATNALELGVDIGGLEAVVLAGYPGTIASTWQQAGRAGRRYVESLAILVAGAGPLDQFLMAHPDYFFDRTPEHARIAPDNPLIVLDHLVCAAYELAWHAEETFGNFPHTALLLEALCREGVLQYSAGRYYWLGEGYPASQVGLRTSGTDRIVITEVAGEATTIGEVDRASAAALIYPGAIYLHEGQSYQIAQLDWEGGRAEAVTVDVDHYTQAVQASEVTVLQVLEEAELPQTTKACGVVRVSQRPTHYRIVRRYTHETLGYGEIDLPPQEMETTAYWLSLAEAALDTLRKLDVWRMDRLDYGPNWEARRLEARRRDSYRCWVCGSAETPGRTHHVHHIRPLRAFLADNPATPRSLVYEQANALVNLMTVCSLCHRRLEALQRVSNAWRGLAHVLANLAPLFVMSDPKDIGLSYDSQLLGGAMPAITLYDRAPGGLGFSEQLYELHDELLTAAALLVADCRCAEGCPACVGPPAGENDQATKAETEALLSVIAR